jgi:hypothetical protein
MIKPGRLPKGYSPYENIFYILKRELERINDLLKSNLSEVTLKYRSERKDKEEKLNEYAKKVKELQEKYLKEGMEPDEVHCNASVEALPILGMYWDLFHDTIENLDLIYKQTVDQLIKSTIISLFSLVEYNLSKAVDIAKAISSDKTRYFSTSISELENFEEIIYISNCIEELERIKFIRNKIIHENSSLLIEGIKEELSFYADCWTAEENRFIFINQNLVDVLVDNTKKLFKSVLNKFDNTKYYG